MFTSGWPSQWRARYPRSAHANLPRTARPGLLSRCTAPLHLSGYRLGQKPLAQRDDQHPGGSRLVRPEPIEASTKLVLLFLAGHAFLAIAMHQIALLATVHAWASFAAACYVALTSKAKCRVVYAAAYLAAAEVLWRMTDALVFWEFGKYAVSAVLLLSLCRHRPAKWNPFALAYFLLLIPSTLLTCTEVTDLSRLRQTISFSLSGPFSLAVCAVCLYRSRLTIRQADRLLLTMLGPLTGVTAICSYSTMQLGSDYEFGNQSNGDVTGGFGPNQVSAMLGLAILLAFLWGRLHQKQRVQRLIALVLALFYFAQAALTFSRTGVWIGVATIVTASLFIVRDHRRLLSSLASLVLVLGIGYFLVYPMLDSFTRGKLSARFEQKGFTGRDQIAIGDLKLGLRHPVFGVGLGMARSVRTRELGVGSAPHTEFTRLIAEHGAFGICALGALCLVGLQAWTGTRLPFGRAWSVSLFSYAVLFMLVTGMRLATPSLAVGLALLQVTGTRNPVPVRRLPVAAK